MRGGTGPALEKLLQSAFMAVCLAAALAGSHAMVGQLSLARAAGDSAGTPVEELRHEILASRRESSLLVQVSWRVPNADLPIVTGRTDAHRAGDFLLDRNRLSGGQHSERNGLGAPLLT